MADKDRISEILSDNGDMDPELLEKISNSCNTLSDEQKNRIFDIVQQKEFADNSENQYEESVNVVEYRRFSMIKYIAAIAACACVILSVSIFSGRNKENILSGNDKVRVTTVCVTECLETSAFTDVSVSQDVSQTARPAVTAVTGNGVQPAVITVTDIKNKQAVTSAKTEGQNNAAEITSAYETNGAKPYPYPEDTDDSAATSVNEDGTIKNSSENDQFENCEDTDEYKGVYKELLDKLRFETDGIDEVRYFIRDMNNDETPELITITGTCEADFTTTFYTVKYHNAEVIGEDFRGDHSFFKIDESTGSFCIESGWNGIGSVVSYVYDGESVKEGKSIKDLSYMYDNDEYENAVSEMFDLRNCEFGRAYKNGKSYLVTADYEEIQLNDDSYTFTD